MKKLIVIFLFTIGLLQAPAAFAYSVSFTDTTKHWNDYGVNWQNNSDYIGTPNLTGGAFIYEGHSLVGINLNYASTSSELYLGDWFFDIDQNGTWDYVLHHELDLASGWRVVDGRWTIVNKGVDHDYGYSLYKVTLAYGDWDSYVESFWPDRYYGRYDHPALANVDDGELLDDDITLAGWSTTQAPGTVSWSDFVLDLSAYDGQAFTYGFAMTCANDVLYGESTIPAPEPGTFLLLGLGSLGLFAYSRKRNRVL